MVAQSYAHRWFCLLFIFAALNASISYISCRVDAATAPTSPAEAVDIGDRLEPFIDDFLIETMRGVSLKLHEPTAANIALRFDQPWEGPVSAYVTVLRGDDRYRMYYRGVHGTATELTCYAESRDGIDWEKPSLGLIEVAGSKSNNVIWTGFGAHNFTPFLDTRPGVPADERYKALAGGPLIALVSADGIRWRKLRDEPVLKKGKFDSQNLAFWDSARNQYAAYFRIFSGVRAIARATSTDFVSWSEPEPIRLGESPPEHFYTNATTPYFRAPHVLLAFPKRFYPARKAVASHSESGVSDGVFMTSRDGLNFDRRFMESFLRPGLDPKNWTDRNNMIAFGVVPTAPHELSIYYSQHYRHETAHVRRATLRTDGFVSVRAPYSGGEFVTKPLVFSGRHLAINYSTSAAGSVRVELQDADGQPLRHFSLNECPEMYGDEIDRRVNWKSTDDLGDLAGKVVRVRFVLKDADLYSMQFVK